jgi:hypothetical protein
MIILMVVDVVNPSPTSILSLFGVGPQKANARVSLDPKALKTVIRWSFGNALGARRSARVVLELMFRHIHPSDFDLVLKNALIRKLLAFIKACQFTPGIAIPLVIFTRLSLPSSVRPRTVLMM